MNHQEETVNRYNDYTFVVTCDRVKIQYAEDQIQKTKKFHCTNNNCPITKNEIT